MSSHRQLSPGGIRGSGFSMDMVSKLLPMQLWGGLLDSKSLSLARSALSGLV